MVPLSRSVVKFAIRVGICNGDDALTLSELRFLTQFEKSMKKDGGLRNFVRSCFAIVDANGRVCSMRDREETNGYVVDDNGV